MYECNNSNIFSSLQVALCSHRDNSGWNQCDLCKYQGTGTLLEGIQTKNRAIFFLFVQLYVCKYVITTH